MNKPYNIEMADYGFTGATIHKIDSTFDSREHGCCKTMCGITYACATITHDDVNCSECKPNYIVHHNSTRKKIACETVEDVRKAISAANWGGFEVESPAGLDTSQFIPF